MGGDPSFVDDIDHRTLAKMLVDNRFLIRVSLSNTCGRTSFTMIVFMQIPVQQFPS